MEGLKVSQYNLSKPEEIGLAAPAKQLIESLPFELNGRRLNSKWTR